MTPKDSGRHLGGGRWPAGTLEHHQSRSQQSPRRQCRRTSQRSAGSNTCQLLITGVLLLLTTTFPLPLHTRRKHAAP